MTKRVVDQREADRVERLLARDRTYRRAEELRAAAEIEVADGVFVNLGDVAVGPTDEQLMKGEFRRVAGEKIPGTVRRVSAMRRVGANRLVQLHARGVIDDDLLAACAWYRVNWDRSGLDARPGVAQWSDGIGGVKAFGQMPRVEREAEARRNIRFAREFIPDDMLALFEFVTIEEMSLRDAARASRCRFSNAPAAFRAAALRLHGGVAHLLAIEPKLSSRENAA